MARKLEVVAWAMVRDGKDWNTQQMSKITESYGRMPSALKDSLTNMKPKEYSDQRKARHRKEAREAKQAQENQSPEPSPPMTKSQKAKVKRTATKPVLEPAKAPRKKTKQGEPKSSH